MLRGCGSCAISERPTPLPRPLFAKADRLVAVPLSSSLAVDCKLSAVGCFSPLSPIIPVDPRHSPVTPIIPVHTQKQGGGGHFSAHGQMPASITYALCYCMLHATQMQNVGAPTLLFWSLPRSAKETSRRAPARRRRTSEDSPCATRTEKPKNPVRGNVPQRWAEAQHLQRLGEFAGIVIRSAARRQGRVSRLWWRARLQK